MTNLSPSFDSDSWTVKPPIVGLLHTEQTSFVVSCMVLCELANPPAIANSRVARKGRKEGAAGCADSVRCRIGLVCLPTETYAFGSRQTAHMLNVDIAVLITAAGVALLGT